MIFLRIVGVYLCAAITVPFIVYQHDALIEGTEENNQLQCAPDLEPPSPDHVYCVMAFSLKTLTAESFWLTEEDVYQCTVDAVKVFGPEGNGILDYEYLRWAGVYPPARRSKDVQTRDIRRGSPEASDTHPEEVKGRADPGAEIESSSGNTPKTAKASYSSTEDDSDEQDDTDGSGYGDIEGGGDRSMEYTTASTLSTTTIARPMVGDDERELDEGGSRRNPDLARGAGGKPSASDETPPRTTNETAPMAKKKTCAECFIACCTTELLDDYDFETAEEMDVDSVEISDFDNDPFFRETDCGGRPIATADASQTSAEIAYALFGVLFILFVIGTLYLIIDCIGRLLFLVYEYCT